MAINAVNLSIMFGWVSSALKLFKANSGSLIGASLVMLLLMIGFALPMIVFMALTMAANGAGASHCRRGDHCRSKKNPHQSAESCHRQSHFLEAALI